MTVWIIVGIIYVQGIEIQLTNASVAFISKDKCEKVIEIVNKATLKCIELEVVE